MFHGSSTVDPRMNHGHSSLYRGGTSLDKARKNAEKKAEQTGTVRPSRGIFFDNG
jgi:hypothetical protein